jgi:hypothetical protein
MGARAGARRSRSRRRRRAPSWGRCLRGRLGWWAPGGRSAVAGRRCSIPRRRCSIARRRSAVARRRGRRGIGRRPVGPDRSRARTDRRSERIQPFRRACLIARRLGRERLRWGAPRSGRRRRLGRGLAILRRRRAPLLASWGLWCRRRCVMRLRRRRPPLLRRLCRRRSRGGRRVVGGRTLRARCRRPRARCSGRQGRAARQAELAGGLIRGATPRADDHESDSQGLRSPIGGLGQRPRNRGAWLRARSIPGFARKGAKSLPLSRCRWGRCPAFSSSVGPLPHLTRPRKLARRGRRA